MLALVYLPPLDVLVPSDALRAALVPLQLDTAAQILGYPMPPPGLMDSAVDGLDLVPSLLWDNVGKICG